MRELEERSKVCAAGGVGLALAGVHAHRDSTRAGAVHIIEGLNHGHGGATGFDASVELGADTARIGLLFIIDDEDFVNDGKGVTDGLLLEGGDDGLGDEVTVGCFSSDDDPEADDGIGCLAFFDGVEMMFHGGGDLEGSGNAEHLDFHLAVNGGEFFFSVFKKGVNELFIILGGNDRDANCFGSIEAWTRGNISSHGGARILCQRGRNVNVTLYCVSGVF